MTSHFSTLLLLILYTEEFIVTELMLWSPPPKKKNRVILTFKSKWWTYSKFERYKLSSRGASLAIYNNKYTLNTKGLVISENHRRRPQWYKFEFSFVRNDHQPSQKSGMRRGKDLFPTIPDDRRYLRFRVSVSGQNLGRSGNSKIHERLEFSRNINIRFKQAKKS